MDEKETKGFTATATSAGSVDPSVFFSSSVHPPVRLSIRNKPLMSGEKRRNPGAEIASASRTAALFTFQAS